MEALAVLAIIVLAPVAVTSTVLQLLRWMSSRGAGGRSWPDAAAWRGQRAARSGPPPAATLQSLVDDLGRLERRYREVEHSQVPARAARLRAVALAYDETLQECCLVLGLPAPGPPPLAGVARLEVEAALAQHGLTW